jgi:copper transport protein
MRRRLGALLAAMLLVAVLPESVSAHGALRRSEPAEGAHLTDAPRALRLTFTEAVELSFARLALSGPNGPVALGALALAPDSATVLVAPVAGGLVAGRYTIAWQVAGADGHPVRGQITFMVAPGAQGLATAPVGPTAPGQATPPVSHHEASTFPTGAAFHAESPLYVAVRWLTFLGLVGVLGVIAFRVVLWGVRRQDPGLGAAFVEPAAARAARLGLWMAALVAVAALLRLYAQSYALHGGAAALQPRLLGTMLGRTLWGWGWLLQAAGTLVAVAGFLVARRLSSVPAAPVGARGATGGESSDAPVTFPATALGTHEGAPEPAARARDEDATLILPEVPSRASDPLPAVRAPIHDARAAALPAPSRPAALGWWVAALGAVLLAFTPGMSGHAASTPRFAPIPIVTDALHVMGAGGWLGSLLAVVLVGIPLALRLAPADRGPAVAALVNAFSPTALFFAAAVTATGVFAAWLHLGEVPALWESTYGRTLLVKLGVLSIVFGTGAYNFLKVKPALGDEVAAGRLRRSAILELAVGAVVLLVTAVLVATATPMGTDMEMDQGDGVAAAASAK